MSELVTIPTRSAVSTQILVIKALLKREIITRFGKYKLGFVWMLVEPLISVLVIGLIIGPIAGRTVPEIPYAFFLLNGRIQLQMFTGSMKSGVNAVKSNQGLLVYRTVQPLDPFIARFLFELLSTSFSFVLFCVIGMWIGIELSLNHLDVLVACGFITWIMGCGMGLIFGVCAAYFKDTEKIVMVLTTPLLFVSAVLTPLVSLPKNAQEFLIYNPLVHTIELSRSALFPFYNTGETNFTYPSIVAIVALAVGIALFQANRHFLNQRSS